MDRRWAVPSSGLKALELAAVKCTRPMDFERYCNMELGSIWGAAVLSDFESCDRRGEFLV